VVRIDRDYGPISKLLGGLIMENDPDTIIITVDDDIIYPPTMIETLLRFSKKYPNSAICSAGLSLGSFPFYYSIKFNQRKNGYWFTMNVPKNGKPIDILYGYSGALYKRKFFEEYEKFKTNFLNKIVKDMDLFRNDDITISYYLAHNNIERRIINMDDVTDTGLHDALSADVYKFFCSLERAVKKCEKMGYKLKRNPINITKTFYFIGISIIVILILILLLLYYII
jgi:hypothetical protein